MVPYDGQTALIVVDMQNDFSDPDGSLYVTGGKHLVGPINREIIAAIARDAFVVYTQDWHPESTPHFEKDGGIWPVHCVGGTWGAAFHPRLVLAGPTVRKGTHGEDGYSGFTVRDPSTGATTSTGLTELLEARGLVSTVVVGLALDYCVGSTARDAVQAGFHTQVSLAHTAAVDLSPGDGDRMVEDLRANNVTVT